MPAKGVGSGAREARGHQANRAKARLTAAAPAEGTSAAVPPKLRWPGKAAQQQASERAPLAAVLPAAKGGGLGSCASHPGPSSATDLTPKCEG